MKSKMIAGILMALTFTLGGCATVQKKQKDREGKAASLGFLMGVAAQQRAAEKSEYKDIKAQLDRLEAALIKDKGIIATPAPTEEAK